MSNRIMELAVLFANSCSPVAGRHTPIAHAALQAEVTRVEADCERFANQTFAAKAEAKTLVDHANDERDALAAKLKRIADLDPAKDSEDGFNEWGEAHCFELAQAIAKEKTT